MIETEHLQIVLVDNTTSITLKSHIDQVKYLEPLMIYINEILVCQSQHTICIDTSMVDATQQTICFPVLMAIQRTVNKLVVSHPSIVIQCTLILHKNTPTIIRKICTALQSMITKRLPTKIDIIYQC